MMYLSYFLFQFLGIWTDVPDNYALDSWCIWQYLLFLPDIVRLVAASFTRYRIAFIILQLDVSRYSYIGTTCASQHGQLGFYQNSHLSPVFPGFPYLSDGAENGTFLPTSDSDKDIYNIGVDVDGSSSQRAYYKSLLSGKAVRYDNDTILLIRAGEASISRYNRT